jgi:hypothetical protein
MNGLRYACPCCGHLTLPKAPPGTFEICPVCRWEDDNVQFDLPDYGGGANSPSLREAQENFKRFGAVTEAEARSARPATREEQPRP